MSRMPDETGCESRADPFTQAGRHLFPRRMIVGLAVAVLGMLIVRPRHLFGKYETLGMVVSCGFLLLGLALRAWAAASAGGHTRTGKIEAPRLSTGGPYAHVRNPIYLGSFLLGLGIIGLIGDPWLLVPHLLVFAFFFGGIVRAEEHFLGQQFGEEYARYRRAVPGFLPMLRPWAGRTERCLLWSAARGEAVIAALAILIYAAFRTVLFFQAHRG